MKINVCDVCWYDDGKDDVIGNNESKALPVGGFAVTYARYTVSFGKGPKKLKLAVCEKHKDVFKGKTYPEADALVNALYLGGL